MALISAQIVSINNQATAPAPTSQPTGYSSSIVSIITETPKNTDVSSNELEENTKLIEEAKKEQEEKNNLNPLYNSQKEDNYSKIKAFADNICAMLGIKHHSAVSEDSFSYNGYDVQKVTRNGMDYVLFVPKDYDPEKEYTLAMYEHGTGEQQCENLSQFINKDQFIQGIFKQQAINVGSDESQKTALGNVIIACPLKNNTSRWDNDAKVAEVKDIANEIAGQYNIGSKTLVGFSAGAGGALYAASENDDNFYDRFVIMSGFDRATAGGGNITDELLAKIKANGSVVVGFSGDRGRELKNPTQSILERTGNGDKYQQVQGDHGQVPKSALADSDGNGLSDLFEAILG